MFAKNIERSRMKRCMNGQAPYASIRIIIGQLKFQQPNYITLLAQLDKERSICFAMNEIEVSLSQKKINFINDIYQKELQSWKEAAFKKALN